MEITLSTVTYADWADVIKTAVKLAKRGDAQARKFLADYLLGPAAQRINVEGGLDNALIIEYVNDWRQHSAAESPQGATDNP